MSLDQDWQDFRNLIARHDVDLELVVWALRDSMLEQEEEQRGLTWSQAAILGFDLSDFILTRGWY